VAGRRPIFEIEWYSVEAEVAAPRRGVGPSPGQELLGVITSHGPIRESYTPIGKATGARVEPGGPPAARPVLFTERMRAALFPETCAAAVLQCAVSAGGTGLVSVEGPAEVSDHGAGQAEAKPAKPAIPETRQAAPIAREKGCCGGREGHHYKVFSMARAAGLAAMSASSVRDGHRCNVFARTRANVRWSASGNENDAGEGGMAGATVFVAGGLVRGSRESPEISLPY
jgi:hypothetical protein